MRTARERVVSWPLSGCGKGTMTDPQMLERTNEWMCPPCFAKKRYGLANGTQEALI